MSNDELSERFALLDKAAKKSDRWWFFALLIIGMCYVGYERHESNEERQELRSEITQVRQEQLVYLRDKTETLATALANNTAALEENTRLIRQLSSRN